MQFKDWFKQNEMADVTNMDTSHIRLEPGLVSKDNSSYSYYFNVNNEEFKVSFRAKKSYVGTFKNAWTVWTISFKGGGGFKLRNIMQGAATAVYTQLLLAIKKLLAIEDVEVLHFSPYDEKMIFIYDRFFDKFLSKDFIRFDLENYFRKDVLRKALSEMEPESAKQIYLNMLDFNRHRLNDKKYIKEFEDKKRKNLRLAPTLVGKFALFSTGYSGFFVAKIIGVESSTTSFRVIRLDPHKEGEIYSTNYPISSLVQNITPTPGEVQKLTQVIQNSNYAQ